MRRFARPAVFVSQCLARPVASVAPEREAHPLVKILRDHVRLVGVCPEKPFTPRGEPLPLHLVRKGRHARLFNYRTGDDLTAPVEKWSERFITKLDEIDGFILKRKSRLCGLASAKLYDSRTAEARVCGRIDGLFASTARSMRPKALFVDDAALDDPDQRERFFTALFARAEFRAVRKSNNLTRLKHFHEYYRTLLEVYHKGHTTELDRIVQNAHSAKPHRAIAAYDQILHRVLLRTPRRRAAAALMLDALSHYAPHLTPQERTMFKRDVAQYVEKALPLSELRKTVQVWAVRYDKTYVRQSAFWRPYPQGLG